MANRKNSHRRRVRVAVLMVLCGAWYQYRQQESEA